MTETKSFCGECENNCCIEFKLYWTLSDIHKLVEEYPFFEIVETGVDLIGNREKVYRKMKCNRLLPDNTCDGYPENRPQFCSNTGVISRPALKCLLHDFITSRK